MIELIINPSELVKDALALIFSIIFIVSIFKKGSD